MKNQLSVAVIGVGHLGQHHARIYSSMDDVNLVGVVDLNEQQGQRIAQTLDTTFYPTLDQLLQQHHLDAASVVVPTVDHYQVSQRLIERNVHLLVEKPLTQTVEQAQKLLDLAKENNCTVQVGHVERFNGAVQKLNQLLEGQKIRCLQSFRESFLSQRISDVGVVHDLMIHDLDLVLWLAKSELKHYRAQVQSVLSAHEDMAMATLDFENGVQAQLFASRVSQHPQRIFKVFTDHATYIVNLVNQTMTEHALEIDPVSGNQRERVTTVTVQPQEPLLYELKDFVHSIRFGHHPLVTGEAGKKALELACNLLKV